MRWPPRCRTSLRPPWCGSTAPSQASFDRVDRDLERSLEQYSGERLRYSERRPVTIDDRALYIYTSGTTGLPKAASVSHGRVMQWTHWFAGLMDTQPEDRLYNCLPMYHSVGGVQAPGAVLAGGGSVVLREKFSASQFWSDIVRWDCTLVQYIGELCRYLLAHGSCSAKRRSIASGWLAEMDCGPRCGTLSRTVSDIPRILEFYAATEGNVSLFNVEGEPGAIGRIPSYLAHRFPAALIQFDVEKGEPVRDEQGFCIRCKAQRSGRSHRPASQRRARISAADSKATPAGRPPKRKSSATFSSRETPGFEPAI